MMNNYKGAVCVFVLFFSFITGTFSKTEGRILPGADCVHEYLPLLKGKRVALLVNQTSMVGKVHLLDTLLSMKVAVKKLFVPEHGFRGTADAGATIQNGTDARTGI